MELRKKAVIALAITTSNNFLRDIMKDESESESSSSDESGDESDMRTRFQLRGQQRKPTRILGYVEQIVPRLSHEQFRQHFRMTPETYDRLEARLAPVLLGVAGTKPNIPVRKQLLATLWLLATPDSYRSVGERFDISKSSLSVSFMRVIQALNDIVEMVIKWPTRDKLAAVKLGFQRITALPDIIGAIDGTHIPIKEPTAVCDSHLLFLDCFTGYPGSVGDLRVFRNSDLWSEVLRDMESYFPHQEYIIGDKAYPALTWCIPPYRDCGNLTHIQRNFNIVLSKARQVIERAFALLKGRFRRLKYLDMNRIDLIPAVILACTVLHNVCLEGLDENIEDFIADGRIEVNNDPEQIHLAVQDQDTGIAKRNYLAALIHQ